MRTAKILHRRLLLGLLVLALACERTTYGPSEKIHLPPQEFSTVTQMTAKLGAPCHVRDEKGGVRRFSYCYCMVRDDPHTWRSTVCTDRCPVWIEYRTRGDVMLEMIPKVQGTFKNDLELLTCPD